MNSVRTWRILLGLVPPAAYVLSGCAQSLESQQSQPAPTVWDSPLPHSAKGYELYSWPAESGQEWQYVLITGTNRLKTYEEIVSAENTVDESGWVKVAATGTEGLISLLSQLQDGETVTWIGRDWSGQMGMSAGSFRLPDRSVIDEIDRYCRQVGVELSVAQ